MKKIKTGKGFRAAYLINRYLQGSISHPEREELKVWLNYSEQNRQLFEELCSAEAMEAELQQFEKADSEAGWQRLEQKMIDRKNARQKLHSWRIGWRSAAAVLLLSLLTWQIVYRSVDKKKDKLLLASQYGEDALPGVKKATLVLSNGSRVLLGDADSLFTEGGSAIQRNANGSLVYTRKEATREAAWNTLYIPNGGEYMIVLPDGSKVWLNAATTLRYPVQFTGRERRVELLAGEAFFEVAKNKEKPFIVMANRMQVQAIGTAFDVNTYPNPDSLVSTTLTEGRVSVDAAGSRYLLEPGRQVNSNKAGATVVEADLEAVTGWKNGLFVFNNAPLQEVMSQVARWYDLQVEFDPRFKEQQFFTGEIKRNVPLSKLLQMLELTGIARFKINDGILLIKPY